MKTNLEALKAVYVKNGGSLTDTYEDIAGGAPVSAYKTLKDAIAALSKLTLGGGGSGLPDVTAEDNGKMLQVESGEWKVKEYPIQTITFFSGNATVAVTTGSSPEILLEGIEGLDSSVKTVTVVRSNTTESNTYTLNYNEVDAFWTGEGAELREDGEYYSLTFFDLTESDIGKVYNITISAERVEPNFKAAMEEVANVVYETSSDVEDAIMDSLGSLIITAIQTGKSNTTVTLPSDFDTAFQIVKIATDVVAGKSVTVKMSSGGNALKPIAGVVNNNHYEYTLLFYYTYESYVFRLTIGISSFPNTAHMFAELMASPNP